MRLGIFGATGRLGREIGIIAAQDPFWTVTAAMGRSAIGTDYGLLLGRSPSEVLVTQVPSEPLPDLFIDVSSPSQLEQKLGYGRPLVIGTTGLSEANRALLQEASRSLPIFYSANFSLGMALLRKMSRELAQFFPDSHIDIIEAHHAGKKDAPSGSALHLANTMREGRSSQGAIPIHSIRSGHIVGEHTVQCNTEEERLVLSHHVHSRKAFAAGALAAARFLLQKPPGLYGMDSLLQETKN